MWYKALWLGIQTHRSWVILGLFAAFALYALLSVGEAVGISATEWMRVYSYRDYHNWHDIFLYLRDLRTGIPPVLSFVEVSSWKLFQSVTWITEDVYRLGIILAVVLPGFFAKRRIWATILAIALGLLMFHSILIVHPGNPQLYDVWLPVFILLGFIFTQLSLSTSKPKLTVALAILGGFFFSMAELARPFMIALFPILIAICGYQYVKAKKKRLFLFYLIPILLFSGGWHLKLLIYNQGQVIWSNHGGTNLFRAWMPLVDQEELNKELQQEAPPLNDYGWALNNINTQIHAENSSARSRAVIKGIAAQPLEALKMFAEKVEFFTRPRTDMYDHNPQDAILAWYRFAVRTLYILLAILLIRSVVKVFKDWRYVFSWEFALLFTTFFLTLMPVIGEAGEEARFIVAVLPFLLVTGNIGAAWISEFLTNVGMLNHCPEPVEGASETSHN